MQNKTLLNCPDSYQISKSDISDCKTIYTISSYPCLKKRFKEKNLSYIMQGSKLPTTLAKHQELFPELSYHQFSLNMTIIRGTHYNSQLSPFWMTKVSHPLHRKQPLAFPPVTSLQPTWENMSNCIKTLIL